MLKHSEKKDIKMNEDEARETDISRRAAIRFVTRHGHDIVEFLEEVEPLENGLFSGEDVLNWLGY